MINASLRFPVLQYKKVSFSLFAHSGVVVFFVVFVFFVLFFNKMAAALLWDSKHTFSSGTCRALATVWGRFHGDCESCNGHQHWLAGNLWSGKGTGCLGLKGNLLLGEGVKNCKLVVFWMTADCCEEKGLTSKENLHGVLKVNASEQNTKSKCYQITSPGSVFFSGCYRLKAGNADKGPGLTGHSLSSKKCRLCICTFHKAEGIFDVWGKWILERPVDIIKKVLFLSLRSTLGLYYQTFCVQDSGSSSHHWLVQVGSAHFKSPSRSFLHL